MSKKKILHCQLYDDDYITTDSGMLHITLGFKNRVPDGYETERVITPPEARILAHRLVELADEIEKP